MGSSRSMPIADDHRPCIEQQSSISESSFARVRIMARIRARVRARDRDRDRDRARVRAGIVWHQP